MGLVNNVLNVSPTGRNQAAKYLVSMEVTELVLHAQVSTQESACQEILWHYEPNVEVHHLGETPHLVGDLPAWVTNTTAACLGRSSLSLFVPQRKRASELLNMTRHNRHSCAECHWKYGPNTVSPLCLSDDEMDILPFFFLQTSIAVLFLK